MDGAADDILHYALYYAAALGKLVLAGACGAAIGWEREAHEKAAGLRTHILLALGACLYALAAVQLRAAYASGADVMRVIQGGLIGTGFICGGVVFREGNTVRGLTTAAGLWIMGAIGVAIGLGFYFIAVSATGLTFLSMTVLKRGERRIRGRIARRKEPQAGDAGAQEKRETERE